MQFLTKETMIVQETSYGSCRDHWGFDPEDIVAILQIKIPVAIFGNQSVQSWFQDIHFPFTVY